MSYRRRKRPVRRSRPSLEHDEDDLEAEGGVLEDTSLHESVDGAVSESPSEIEKATKQQEVWEAFREEHYEGASLSSFVVSSTTVFTV